MTHGDRAIAFPSLQQVCFPGRRGYRMGRTSDIRSLADDPRMHLVDKPVTTLQQAEPRSQTIEQSARRIQWVFDGLLDGLVQTPLNAARNGPARQRVESRNSG